MMPQRQAGVYLTVIGIAACLILVWRTSEALLRPNPAQSRLTVETPHAGQTAHKDEPIWREATNLISRRLLTPAAARFDRETFVVLELAGRRTASGTVHSQNIYGALLSERYEVDLETMKPKFWSEDSPLLTKEKKIWH